MSVLLVLGLLIGGFGCKAPEVAPTPKPTPAPEIEKPFLEVSVSRLSIHCPTSVPPQMAYKYARMMIDFKIYNPNDVPVILDKLEYAVYGNDHVVGGTGRMVSGEYQDRTIPPGGIANVSFPLPYISKDEDAAIWDKMIKGNVTWTFKGVAHIRTPSDELDVPFESTVEDYSLQIDERCL